jgi:hypothetical protein
LIPELQLPAMSQTLPEGMSTADPFVAVDCVNVACAAFARPDVASDAVNPAVCVPRHQPAEPANEQMVVAPFRATTGATESIFTVAVTTGAEVFPAVSVAVQDTVCDPSPVTARLHVAVIVVSPVGAPPAGEPSIVHAIDATAILSVAPALPVAVADVNHWFCPLGANVTVTAGGVVSMVH